MSTQENGKNALFETDHLKRNLGRRSLFGGLTIGAGQLSRFGIYVATMAILARLLSVEEFGVVATVGALTSFLRIFQDAGLSTATIQRDEVTEAQVSNLFWINSALGLLAALIASAVSPAVAWFFRDERLALITVTLSLTFVVTGATVQYQALLTRQMRYTTLSVITVTSMLFGLAVSVGMALQGFGYWSLVGLQVATPAWVLVASVFCTRWRPRLYRRGNQTRSMVTLGANLTIAAMMRSVSESMSTLLIGRVFGLTAVGYYSSASAILQRPLNQLFAPFDRVMVPSLSRMQNDPERYRKAFLRVYGLIALAAFPATALVIGLGKPIVYVVLGSGWDQVVPLFQALSFCLLSVPLTNAAMWLLTTQARKEEILTIGWLFPVNTIVWALIGLPFGVLGVAIATSASKVCVRLPIANYIVGRRGPVTTRDLWSMYVRHLPSVPAVLAGIWIAKFLFPGMSPIVELVVGGSFGVVFAIIVVVLIPAQRRDLLGLLDLKRLIGSRRKYEASAPVVS